MPIAPRPPRLMPYPMSVQLGFDPAKEANEWMADAEAEIERLRTALLAIADGEGDACTIAQQTLGLTADEATQARRLSDREEGL